MVAVNELIKKKNIEYKLIFIISQNKLNEMKLMSSLINDLTSLFKKKFFFFFFFIQNGKITFF